MSRIEHLHSTTLDLPPSCIEFDPNSPQYAVVGTYNLEKQSEQHLNGDDADKKPQSRNGSLILIQVIGDEVKLVQTLPTPSAILDIHFTSRAAAQASSQFGVATSTGSIGIYNLVTRPDNVPEVVHITTIQFFPEDVLITAFAWHPDGQSLGMALSSGQIYLGRSLNLSSNAGSPSPADVMMHDLEAWTLAFVPDGSGMLSGGDDCALRFAELPPNPMNSYDNLSLDTEYVPRRKSPWVEKKIHGAGVTAILPIDWDASGLLVVTGSYDDNIRLLHAPSVGRRQVLAEMNLGGGVWRLKVLNAKRTPRQGSERHPGASHGKPDEILLLVSCMHAGARIVQLLRKGNEWAFEVLAKFEEHKSMNYGSDCQPEVNEQGKRTFVTTSFYDRLLCLWRY